MSISNDDLRKCMRGHNSNLAFATPKGLSWASVEGQKGAKFGGIAEDGQCHPPSTESFSDMFSESAANRLTILNFSASSL